jgi:5,5'-dehydrodivanillate O-demethylase
MGEDLVLFRRDSLARPDPSGRDGQGGYGLVGEHCSHRGASLYYGFLEDGCIRCPYHGWLYDREGHCVKQPFEPEQSLMKYTIRHPAYPVQELGGLLWTYMGPPDEQPLLPRWDMLVREDGEREYQVYPVLNANWLQAEENTADSTHVHFLHGRLSEVLGISRGFGPLRPVLDYGFQPFEWGILKTLRFGGEKESLYYGRPLVFPNILRLGGMMHWRVPLDDTHTQIFWLNFRPSKDGKPVDQSNGPRVTYMPSWKNEQGEYTLADTACQDTMAWETQGPLYDRTRENLGASDHGIAMFRRMLMEQIAKVQRGEAPMALVRDPELNEIIHIPDWTAVEGEAARGARHGSVATGTEMDTYFDGRYEVFEVPAGAARW